MLSQYEGFASERYFLILLVTDGLSHWIHNMRCSHLWEVHIRRRSNCTVPTFNSCFKGVGSPGIIHDRTPDCHTVSWVWMHGWHLTTERSFDLQAMWVIGVLRLYFDMLSMGVCTIRHWHTPGRLVQKLNVCTAYSLPWGIVCPPFPYRNHQNECTLCLCLPSLLNHSSTKVKKYFQNKSK